MKRSEKTRLSRERILKGAEVVFLQHGYDGASMKTIAQTCETTQSLIHHHFNNKQTLWQAVLEHRFSRVLEALRPQLTAAMRRPDVPVALLDVYLDYLEQHPDYVRLLAWLSATGQHEIATGRAAPLVEVLKAQQKHGKLRADIDAQALLTFVWSIAEGWALGSQRFSGRLNTDLNESPAREQLRNTFCQILTQGTNPPAIV